MTKRFISSVLGQQTISESEKVLDYVNIIQREVSFRVDLSGFKSH